LAVAKYLLVSLSPTKNCVLIAMVAEGKTLQLQLHAVRLNLENPDIYLNGQHQNIMLVESNGLTFSNDAAQKISHI
jgi:hypothetical protein